MLEKSKKPLILGHRGASWGRLGNSRDAFAAARTEGADGVELDVRATADRVLAVIHDPVIEGLGAVAENSFHQLTEASHGEILRLEQALEILDGQVIDIEIKSNPDEVGWVPSEFTARLLARQLASYRASARIFVSSFSTVALDVFSQLSPGYPLGVLSYVGEDIDAACQKSLAADAKYAVVHHLGLDPEKVAKVHACGLEVMVWTVDDPGRMVELASYGVEGIITNRVDLAIAALGAKI